MFFRMISVLLCSCLLAVSIPQVSYGAEETVIEEAMTESSITQDTEESEEEAPSEPEASSEDEEAPSSEELPDEEPSNEEFSSEESSGLLLVISLLLLFSISLFGITELLFVSNEDDLVGFADKSTLFIKTLIKIITINKQPIKKKFFCLESSIYFTP